MTKRIWERQISATTVHLQYAWVIGSRTPAAAFGKSLQSCPTLCDPIDSSPPGSPISGTLQARTLEWVAISSPSMKVKSQSEVSQSCPTLSNPMDCSPPGSSVHGILQAGVLEWGAIAFSGSVSQSCPNLCNLMDCSRQAPLMSPALAGGFFNHYHHLRSPFYT